MVIIAVTWTQPRERLETTGAAARPSGGPGSTITGLSKVVRAMCRPITGANTSTKSTKRISATLRSRWAAGAPVRAREEKKVMAHLIRPAAWGRSRASQIKRSGAGHAAGTQGGMVLRLL